MRPTLFKIIFKKNVFTTKSRTKEGRLSNSIHDTKVCNIITSHIRDEFTYPANIFNTILSGQVI